MQCAAIAVLAGLLAAAGPDLRPPAPQPALRVIARSAPEAGEVSKTVPPPPPTAAAVPQPPASGPQLSSPSAPGARLDTAPPPASTRSRSAGATASRLPPSSDAVLATIANPLARAERPPGGALQACIDRQLARRGLNGFGDPPATRYPGGAPVPADSIERYRYVLERSPLIGTACAASTPFR